MPCDGRASEARRKAALKKLEEQLKSMQARVVKTATGMAIEGWEGDRAEFCDECAIAQLKIHGSFETRQRIAEAETSAVSTFAGGHGHDHGPGGHSH